MPSDLTQAEKDDKQVERLIDKKPPPSRKKTQRRGPKHDNRRRRMKQADPSDKPDKDLARKLSSLLSIAWIVASGPEDGHKPDVATQGKDLVREYMAELGRYSKKVKQDFREYAKTEYVPILEAKIGAPGKGKDDPNRVMLARQKEIVKHITKLLSALRKKSSVKLKGSPAEIAAKVAELWPNGKKNFWSSRAGTIGAVQSSIDALNAPPALKMVLSKDPNNVKKNAKLIREFLQHSLTSSKADDLADSDVIEIAALAATFRILLENPETVDAGALAREVDDLTKHVYEEAQKLLVVPAFMESWEKAVDSFSKGSEKRKEHIRASEYYDEVDKSLKNFFKSDEDPPFDSSSFIDGLESVMGDKYKDAPDVLKKMVEGYRSAATSYNGIRGKAMGHKTATYHGVIQQGDPTNGPYPGYTSYDRRFFGKEHYDSIIKTAKAFLKEDWLKYHWDTGSQDAPYRAALDLSIHLADSSLYQAKIDVETYNMLLARLMDKDDTFAETLITHFDGEAKPPRRASVMNNPQYQALLRVASELRHENPRAAMEIVKSLRGLRIAQDEQLPDQGQTAQPQQGQQEQQSQEQQQSQQEQQGQQEQQSQITQADTDAFVDGKVDIQGLKGKLKELVNAQDIEDFIDGLKSLDEVLKKTASGRSASSEVAGVEDLAPLADMDDSQVQEFLKKMKGEADKVSKENDIEKFMEGLDALLSEAEKAAGSIKTSSVTISLSTLIHLASENPEARPVLVGIIRDAAKKKKKKKAPKKAPKKTEKKGPPKDTKSKGDKKPPFGGKKAPPFGGKKAPPFGKKKSSVTVEASDSEW